MKTGTCPKCGEACEVIFRRFIVKNGKTIYPKTGLVFPIPLCKCGKDE